MKRWLAVYKPREEASEETNFVDPLILDFQPPELGANTFLGLNHPVCGSLLWQPEQTNIELLR